MLEPSPLTTGFIEKRPRSAAQALGEMEPADGAAFLEALPVRLAVTLLSEMNSWPASVLITAMRVDSAAAILGTMDYPSAASILRLVPETERAALAKALPATLRKRLETTLSYPPDTVGARTNTSVITLRPDQSVGEALQELRQIKRAKTGVVFVVDPAKRYLGMIAAAEIVQRSNENPLSEAMDSSVSPLSARARLTGVSSLPAWDDYAQLPVVNRQKLLIGALSRTHAQKLDRLEARSPRTAPNGSIASAMADAFFASAIGLARLLAWEEQPGGRNDAAAAKPKTGASR